MSDVTYGTTDVCAACGDTIQAVPAPSCTSLDPCWQDPDGRYGCPDEQHPGRYRPHHPAGWELVIDRDRRGGWPIGSRWEVSA